MDHTGPHFLIISISSISKRNSEMTSFFCNRIEFTLHCILNGSNYYKNHIITLTSYSLGKGGVKVCGPILDASGHLSKKYNLFPVITCLFSPYKEFRNTLYLIKPSCCKEWSCLTIENSKNLWSKEAKF